MTEKINREHIPVITAFIKQLATRSEAFAWQAGVGGVETVGHIISYLAENPQHVEPFLNGGNFELPMNWIENGCLTYRAINGQIVHPQTARHAQIVKKLKGDAA